MVLHTPSFKANFRSGHHENIDYKQPFRRALQRWSLTPYFDLHAKLKTNKEKKKQKPLGTLISAS